jgi:branched-chain amino acid transport system ATP-binding protein
VTTVTSSERDVDAVFVATGLGKSFSGVRALDGADLQLRRGRILGIIGPNGAGKSTLINLATGLFRADAGTIVFDGRDVSRLSLARRARLGLLRSFQQTRVFGSMTVREALRLGGECPRAAGDADPHVAAEAAIQRFGLGEFADRVTSETPYGVQKVLNIALVAMSEPKALFLDEPFAGVASEDVERISRVIEAIRDEGVAIGLVEHNIEELLRLADAVVVLDSGRMIFEGTPAEARVSEVVREAYLGRGLAARKERQSR